MRSEQAGREGTPKHPEAVTERGTQTGIPEYLYAYWARKQGMNQKGTGVWDFPQVMEAGGNGRERTADRAGLLQERRSSTEAWRRAWGRWRRTQTQVPYGVRPPVAAPSEAMGEEVGGEGDEERGGEETRSQPRK